MNFEEASLPHLNAAHNLARWLTKNDVDAQDVVQEALVQQQLRLVHPIGRRNMSDIPLIEGNNRKEKAVEVISQVSKRERERGDCK